MGDMKSNEYRSLIGGERYETHEDNPMLGVRGASRYYSDRFREAFRLECEAIKRVRSRIGLDNVKVMIPFCRTPEEADRVNDLLEEYGVTDGSNPPDVYVMAEIPSNIVLTEEFADRFDGFSIGSNDLTQLMLGVDRDSEALSDLFDERNDAVKRPIADLIQRAHRSDRPVGICGQAPSDYPDFAAFLVEEGIDSISLNPDSVLGVKKRIASAEATDKH
jgi:pyruvate,water dikinase